MDLLIAFLFGLALAEVCSYISYKADLDEIEERMNKRYKEFMEMFTE